MIVHHGAAAEADNANRALAAVAGRQRRLDRPAFQPPELGLAVGDEDVGDRLASGRLDGGISIGESDAKQGRQ